MSRILSMQRMLLAGALTAMAFVSALAQAQPTKLSEVFINSPGSPDNDEYWEIEGSGTMSTLSTGTRYYLVQVENEGANAGIVDWVLLLNGTFSGGRFLVAEDSENIGTPQQTYNHDFLENSGGTFLILQVPTGTGTPAAAQDWDTDADTSFEGAFNASWTVIDSVGVVCEQDDVCSSKLFASVNFYAGEANEATCITSSGTEIATNIGRKACRGPICEIEYVGRCSDDVWFVANVQDESGGSTNIYEVSETCGPLAVDQNETIPAAALNNVATPGAAPFSCLDTACTVCGCP